jgi:YVTN family beta-propeller protein
MKLQIAALGFSLTALLAPRVAFALTITMQSAVAVPTGKEQTFHVAKVDDAIGNVTFRWDFGDGSTLGPAPDLQASHTYKDAGHYTVIVMGTDDQSGGSASFVQTVNNPLTARPPHNSSTILVDAERHRVWNVNPDSNSVSVIDADALKRVRELPVGSEPQTLAQAPDGTIWVTNKMSDEVIVLNRDSLTIEARIALPYASQPRAISFGPNGMAYVSLYATGELVEIDAGSRKVGRHVATGPTPAGIAVADDGRIFVTRFVSPIDHGEVWVVSPEAMVVVNTIVLPFDNSPDSSVGGRGVPNFVSSIVISPDGTQAWVTAKKDDVARGPKRDGLPMNSDNFVRSIVCAIDLKTETETIQRRQDLDNRSMPATVVFSPVGDYAYISLILNNEISISDAYVAFNVGAIRNVGSAPDGLAFAPDGTLFANASLTREVIAYDLRSSLASIDQGAPPPLAKIGTVDHEPLSDEILLGKQVFFNAMDPRMSAVGYMSCASCHIGGISDGRVWDFTDRGEGLRNTKSLLGVRGVKAEGRLHWSANMDEVQDFERDIRDSQGGTGFMSDEEFNARKDASGTYDTFGKPAAGASKELDALSAFVTSLDKVPRSPFRNPDGSFTSDALEGRKIFQKAGCPECHSGPDFTDSSLSPTGPVHDVGTILPTSGNRLGGKLSGIDTPTLKGVWQSGPYLHDGRAETLTEIFTKYIPKDTMGITSDLTTTEMDQLVRYLLELDDVPETIVPDHATPSPGPSCAMTRTTAGSSSQPVATWLLALGSVWILKRRRTAREQRAR